MSENDPRAVMAEHSGHSEGKSGGCSWVVWNADAPRRCETYRLAAELVAVQELRHRAHGPGCREYPYVGAHCEPYRLANALQESFDRRNR